MKKILELGEPLIKCYPHHANIVAGLMTNDYDYSYIANNYVQLVYRRDLERLDFNYGMDIEWFIKNYPMVESYCYNRRDIKKYWKTYSNFVKDQIDQGFFSHFLIDMYYISAYEENYMQYHYGHNITVYGYDDEYLYVADNFVYGKYSFQKIPIHEIDDGGYPEHEYDWLEGVYCWKFRENAYTGMQVNEKDLKKHLNGYIHSTRTQALTKYESDHRDKNNYVYGISIYDELIRYVKTLTEEIDTRIPNIFVEQSSSLLYLCDDLFHRFMLRDYEKNRENLINIKKDRIIIQNLFLKYYYKKKEKIIDEIIRRIQYIKQEEIEYLTKLYHDIGKSNDLQIEKIHSVLKLDAPGKFYYDRTTKGSWKGTFGSLGYDIVGDKRNLPQGIEIRNYQSCYVLLKRNEADERGMERANSNARVAAYILHKSYFFVQIRNESSKVKRVSFYLVDYDRLGREVEVQVWNKKEHTLLYRETIKDFAEGEYITFDLLEEVQVYFILKKGPDAVVSGIFFD